MYLFKKNTFKDENYDLLAELYIIVWLFEHT